MPPIPKAMVKPGYRPQAEDTCLDADVFQFSLLRQWDIADRLKLTAKLTKQLRALCLAGIKRRGCPAAEVRSRFDQAVLAENWHSSFQPTGTDEMVWIQDSIELASQLHVLLEADKIPYFVGGGVASSAHGEPRSTRDLDLVLQLALADIGTLVQALTAAGFYCPVGGVEDIKQGRSRTLNITNIQSSANADLFMLEGTSFANSQMARRELISITATDAFWICSPEDIILQKLLWRRGSKSEQQWRDVLGVMKVQGTGLDFDYLWQWAAELGITEALVLALEQAGL